MFFWSGCGFNAVHLWRFNFVKIVNKIDGLLHWRLCKLLLFLVWHNVHNVLFCFWGLISGGFSVEALSTEVCKVHLGTADLGAPWDSLCHPPGSAGGSFYGFYWCWYWIQWLSITRRSTGFDSVRAATHTNRIRWLPFRHKKFIWATEISFYDCEMKQTWM